MHAARGIDCGGGIAVQGQSQSQSAAALVEEHETHEANAAALTRKTMPIQPAGFIPLLLKLTETAASTSNIVIEMQRGAGMVTVRWPASAGAECAT